jgi:hypothetical protein
MRIFEDREDSPAVEQVAGPAMSAVPPTESAGRTACQYRRMVYTLYRAHRLHFATFLR